jgi:hypothetical protein
VKFLKNTGGGDMVGEVTILYLYLQRKVTDERCSFPFAFEDGTFLRIYFVTDSDNVKAFVDRVMKVNVIQYVAMCTVL